MVEKIRLGGNWSAKKITAIVLFGAIILVFALLDVRNLGGGGDVSSGVAAVVNDHTISMAEFRNRSDQIERTARGRFDGLPEAQRRLFSQDLRRRVLESLIAQEAIFQAAQKSGILASDTEVKEQILQLTPFQENGRFLAERYRMYLQNSGMSAEEFERQIRKELVNEKLQELFVGSAAPTRAELKHNRALANQKLSLKFAELSREALVKLSAPSASEVDTYLKAHGSEVEAYYKDNQLEFTKPETYHARDIAIRIDEKRNEADALKAAQKLRAELTPANFAKMATKSSDDPGTRAKGGDLGVRERGSAATEFEAAAVALNAGEISQPVKVEDAYHLILLEAKTPSQTVALEAARAGIARKLLARGQEADVVNRVRTTLEKGDRKAVDALLSQVGTKWQDSGEFDLSSNVVPKLGDAKDVLNAVLRGGRSTGLVKTLVPHQNGYVVVDVTAWREVPDTTIELEGLDRMVAFRKAETLLDAWARDVVERTTIQRNSRLLQ